MTNHISLQNLFFIGLIMMIIGLGCSSDETVDRGPLPKRTPDDRSRIDKKEVANENINENMTNTAENNSVNVDRTDFNSVLEFILSKRSLKKGDICDEKNPVEKRILNEYGALFLTTAIPPSTCMFKSADEVADFQKKVPTNIEQIAGFPVELQSDAMKALLSAREEARSNGFDITPRDGAEASKRGFDDTLRLWNSRFEPACKHWTQKGKLTESQVSNLRSLQIDEQVREVLELEKAGIFFNTFFNATILSSVAAPGTSQHLSMLAFDANEFANETVRTILGNHGWFRTVKGDAPHFTFLGVKLEDLKNMGLQKVETKDGSFWVPNIRL